MSAFKKGPAGYVYVGLSAVGTVMPLQSAGIAFSGLSKYLGQAVGNVLLPARKETRADYEKRLALLNKGRQQKMLSIYTTAGKNQYIVVQKIMARLKGRPYLPQKDPVLRQITPLFHLTARGRD